MADIEIRMLGKFEILMDGKPVLAALKQSRKATMLIQYLVLQKGEKVTHKDLTDTLWNGERSTNPDMALRAIMHRFRNMIDAEGLKELETCIITSRGYYQWNPTMECRVDVFEMEARRRRSPLRARAGAVCWPSAADVLQRALGRDPQPDPARAVPHRAVPGAGSLQAQG
mgnify:CR=1 FL=1